jgi:hypothetical protein
MRHLTLREGKHLMKRLLLAALCGAVILFFWGFLWFGLLPGAKLTTQSMPEGAQEAITAMTAANLPSGTYLYPPSSDATPEAIAQTQAAFAKGPVVRVHYRQEGATFMDPKVMLTGFAHFLAAAFIISWLANLLGITDRSWRDRLLFVAGIGFLIGFVGRFSEPIWYFAPWPFFLYYAAFDLTGWTLAGLAMASINRR